MYRRENQRSVTQPRKVQRGRLPKTGFSDNPVSRPPTLMRQGPTGAAIISAASQARPDRGSGGVTAITAASSCTLLAMHYGLHGQPELYNTAAH